MDRDTSVAIRDGPGRRSGWCGREVRASRNAISLFESPVSRRKQGWSWELELDDDVGCVSERRRPYCKNVNKFGNFNMLASASIRDW